MNIDLGLPPESIQREKSVGMWYEGGTLRVRGHLRDRYTDPERQETLLHEYRLDLWVDHETMIVSDARIEPVHLPYAECFQAPGNIGLLVGLKLRPGFTAEALERLQGEAG
ncbi:MAG: DUF2889 domain-containing protein, partial [Actinobacteria bacterium]|nr:DUF2889 domain-containing protein [Actinomycetota bacterium]